MFLKNSELMYKVQSSKNDTKAKIKIIEFFQYFCEKTILKTHGPIRVSYGFDRAGKSAHNKREETFKKHAHSVQAYGPRLSPAF